MASSVSDGQRARKRQKFTHDSSAHHPLPTTLGATASLPNSSAAMSVADSPAKSALKGRRRYNADIEGMIHACEKGFECATLKITGALREHIPIIYGGLQLLERRALDFQRGDDDMFTCRILDTSNPGPISLEFIISGELVNDHGRGKD